MSKNTLTMIFRISENSSSTYRSLSKLYSQVLTSIQYITKILLRPISYWRPQSQNGGRKWPTSYGTAVFLRDFKRFQSP